MRQVDVYVPEGLSDGNIELLVSRFSEKVTLMQDSHNMLLFASGVHPWRCLEIVSLEKEKRVSQESMLTDILSYVYLQRRQV